VTAIRTDELSRALHEGFGASATVRPRRPGKLYQVDIPSYLADGDSAGVYVRPEEDGRVTLTDLGHTCMRLSYTRRLNERTDAAIRKLSERHGFQFFSGEIFATMPLQEITAGAIALAQIESSAESALTALTSRGVSGERFKKIVRDALREVVAEYCTFNYKSESDTEGLYAIDAAMTATPTWLGIAIVPSDIEAERAISNRLYISRELDAAKKKHRWLAILRDVNDLRDMTRKRLLQTYVSQIPVYEEQKGTLRDTIVNLADLRAA